MGILPMISSFQGSALERMNDLRLCLNTDFTRSNFNRPYQEGVEAGPRFQFLAPGRRTATRREGYKEKLLLNR